MLCGDASRLFLDHFSKHLSSVLGWTELCHEVRNPGPQKPQIIRNENHHLALLDFCSRLKTSRIQEVLDEQEHNMMDTLFKFSSYTLLLGQKGEDRHLFKVTQCVIPSGGIAHKVWTLRVKILTLKAKSGP